MDVLVEFDDRHAPDFFDLYELEQEFSVLFGGRAIDLVTQKTLHRHLQDKILTRAVVLYESPM